ncbi:helix-turn-helix transcriptional regulator [Alteromonas ponticola]|uniref:Helix-turn-helix transcriptional regulator n=1 Tax=Alteromonas aquimaris TaxID=2998417 RepID=A0ABT3PBA4_9ALTE|nr:helix-turn-helix transcriptional regulator [Alteromonas aquimaris]MCW8109366.1 helix-turn-helix transcriptional regulator [Alteromonas aquimaris]
MYSEQPCLVLTGTQPALMKEVCSSLDNVLPVSTAAFSQFTLNDQPAPELVAYVMSNLNSKHAYNIDSLKTKGCRFLVVIAQHLTLPSLCELLRLHVDDVVLLPCYPQDCIRLQDSILPRLAPSHDTRHITKIQQLELGCSAQNSINIEEIIQLIEEHFCAKLTLARVANELNLSPSRVSHLFKDICGLCFRQYLTCRRLEAAEMLLDNPKSNITSVGFALGFSSPSHFCRSFKEQFGLTPRAYMEGCREFVLNDVYKRYQNLRLNILPAMQATARQRVPVERTQLHSIG